MGSSAAARVATAVRDTFGVFTPAQLEPLKVTRQQIRRMLDRGEVERLRRGVYVHAAFADSWERRAMAAIVVADSVVLSHGAAVRILGLEHLGVPRAPDIEVTAARDHRPTVPGVPVHESLILTTDDVWHVGSLRVTSAVFTLGAMATRRSPDRIARSLDAAVANRQTTVAEARDLAVRMWHTPGVVCLRDAIEQVTPAAAMTRSDMERLFLRICRTFAIPLPETNVRVEDRNGDRRYVDFLYRDAGLVVEINAHPSHATTLGRRRDGARQNALVPRFVLLNYDAADVTRQPDRVADEVRRALEELRPADPLPQVDAVPP